MSPSSIFDSDIVGSPSTPSIWSTQPSDIRHPIKENTKIISSNISEGHVPHVGHNLLQNSLFKTVADFERDLLKHPKPLTLAELEKNILTSGSLPPGSIRSVEEIEAELTGNHK